MPNTTINRAAPAAATAADLAELAASICSAADSAEHHEALMVGLDALFEAIAHMGNEDGTHSERLARLGGFVVGTLEGEFALGRVRLADMARRLNAYAAATPRECP